MQWRTVLVMGLGLLALPDMAQAQQQPPIVWPDPPTVQRQAPPPPAAQQQTPPAARQPARQPARTSPARPAAPAQEPEDDDRSARGPAAARAKPSAAAAQNIRCDGPFAKDTSHAKLAQTFGAKNVVFQPVDGPEGSKLNATVVFPNDRKRRLEVLWHDESARQRPSSIVVGADSGWRARGFRIGDPLTLVEKTNGKPFMLAGFAGEYGGVARDWRGGALDKLSGDCRLGMRFVLDPKAAPAARGKVESDGDLTSDNADVRAANPLIAELIIGYPQ
jgi:hypothetical protein